MLGEEQLWGDTKVREQKLASGVQTPRRRVGSDSVQTCEAPGSALRVYHPQTALRLHLETVSLSHVATYVNVTQDAPTQEGMWGAPRFSSCRNAGAPLGIQWLHDTLGRHPRSCSPPVQPARTTQAPLPSTVWWAHWLPSQKGQNGQGGPRLLPKALRVPTGPCTARTPHEVYVTVDLFPSLPQIPPSPMSQSSSPRMDSGSPRGCIKASLSAL